MKRKIIKILNGWNMKMVDNVETSEHLKADIFEGQRTVTQKYLGQILSAD